MRALKVLVALLCGMVVASCVTKVLPDTTRVVELYVPSCA